MYHFYARRNVRRLSFKQFIWFMDTLANITHKLGKLSISDCDRRLRAQRTNVLLSYKIHPNKD
jgi:hypothetical protein